MDHPKTHVALVLAILSLVLGCIAAVLVCHNEFDSIVRWSPTGPLTAGDIVVVHRADGISITNTSPFMYTYHGWSYAPLHQHCTDMGDYWRKDRAGFCMVGVAIRVLRPGQELIVEDTDGFRHYGNYKECFTVVCEGTNGPVTIPILVHALDS